jgi:hypothetical protein
MNTILSKKALEASRYARTQISQEINRLYKDIDRLILMKGRDVSRDYLACAIRDRRVEIHELKSKLKRYYGVNV